MNQTVHIPILWGGQDVPVWALLLIIPTIVVSVDQEQLAAFRKAVAKRVQGAQLGATV